MTNPTLPAEPVANYRTISELRSRCEDQNDIDAEIAARKKAERERDAFMGLSNEMHDKYIQVGIVARDLQSQLAASEARSERRRKLIVEIWKYESPGEWTVGMQRDAATEIADTGEAKVGPG